MNGPSYGFGGGASHHTPATRVSAAPGDAQGTGPAPEAGAGGEETAAELSATSECPHCPDGHTDPKTRPWSAWVTTQLDDDGQPNAIIVAPSRGGHVSEADAEWIREALRKARRST